MYKINDAFNQRSSFLVLKFTVKCFVSKQKNKINSRD